MFQPLREKLSVTVSIEGGKSSSKPQQPQPGWLGGVENKLSKKVLDHAAERVPAGVAQHMNHYEAKPVALTNAVYRYRSLLTVRFWLIWWLVS
jgi:hypothetical protein